MAKSNDLASEFSDSVLSFDLKNGRHVSVPRSALRVWKKENGEWKEAAYFSREPYRSPASSQVAIYPTDRTRLTRSA